MEAKPSARTRSKDALKGSQRHFRNGVAFFFVLTAPNVSVVPKAEVRHLWLLVA